MVVIFHFGLGQGGLFHHAPHHRLGPLVERTIQQEFAQLAHDGCFGGIGHGGVRIGPIGHDAQTLEFRLLHADPMGGEFPAFIAELDDIHLVLVLTGFAVFFFDLPFDGQAVAIPAGDVMGVHALHLPGAVDDVLQDLVQGMADMQMAVRIGRAIMQHELFAALARLAQALEQTDFGPSRQQIRLFLRQASFHGKVGLGQENIVFYVVCHSISS